MAAVLVCGNECGLAVSGLHKISGGTAPTFDTSTVRTGARSRKYERTGSNGHSYDNVDSNSGGPISSAARIWVGRMYIRFATLPNQPSAIVNTYNFGTEAGVRFNNSDNKLYCSLGSASFVGTGVSVTTGVWYRLDWKINKSANPWTIDAQVDGTALSQATSSQAAQDLGFITMGLGHNLTATQGSMFTDDEIHSVTAGDYPFGHGHVVRRSPTGDGSHNTANTANTFERGNTGTDIIDSTTDAYQLIDDVPLPSGSVDAADNIQITNNTPTNTWYTEHVFDDGEIGAAPRAVDALMVNHEGGTSGCGRQVRLRDTNGGTEATLYSSTGSGATAYRYTRACYATIPGGGAWTETAFNALVVRWGYSADANPDVNLDAFMLEVEFLDPRITIDSDLQKVTAALNATQSSGITGTIDSDLQRITAALSGYLAAGPNIVTTIARVVASLNAQQRYLTTAAATLRPVSASLNVVQRDLVTIDSDLIKVQASLNLEQRDFVTIDADLAKVVAALNVAQPFTVTIDSDLQKVQAALSARQSQLVTIDSDLVPVQSSINLEQRQLFTIDSDLMKVQAALSVAQPFTVTIDSDLSRVIASLNAEQRYLATISAQLTRVVGSLNVLQSQFVTIDSDLARVTASLQVNAVSDSFFVNISSQLSKVKASLNLSVPYTFTIDSDLAKVMAILNARQSYLTTIDSDLVKVSSSISLSQIYTVMLSSILSKVTSNLSLRQIQLVTIAATLVQMQAHLEALNSEGFVTIQIVTALRHVVAALDMHVEPWVSALDLLGAVIPEVIAEGQANPSTSGLGSVNPGVPLSGAVAKPTLRGAAIPEVSL